MLLEWSKVKNIILLILLLVNVLLLGQTVGQERQSRQYRQEALDGAVEALRQQGYEVDMSALADERDLVPLSAERDRESEERLAQALLGPVSRTEDGVRTSYQGAGGSCWFRGDGSFSFIFELGTYPLSGGEAGSHGRKLLTGAGYPCEVTTVKEGEDAVEVTLVQTWEGAPVFSCFVKLTYLDGVLTELEGIRLVGVPAREGEGEKLMDLPTALIRFMAGMREGGHVFTRIEDMTAGYQVTSAGRRMSLRPVWQVVTDVDTMLVDGITGALSAK